MIWGGDLSPSQEVYGSTDMKYADLKRWSDDLIEKDVGLNMVCSPPARWGPLDFNNSATPSPPHPPLPDPDAVGHAWTRTLSQAPDAVGHAWTGRHARESSL